MTRSKLPPTLLVWLMLAGVPLLSNTPGAKADEPTPLASAPTAPTPITPAPATPLAEEPPPSPEDVAQFLQLARTINASYALVDINAQRDSLDDLAERVHKTLASPKSLGTGAPRIEVRSVKPVRLSFGVQGWTVGATLHSGGLFGDAVLWVRSNLLLLAPKSALTPQELADLKSGKMVEWRPIDDQHPNLLLDFKGRKTLLSFVANELKNLNPEMAALLKTGSIKDFSAVSQLPGKPITLGQLSPTSQAIVLQMVNAYNDQLSQEPFFNVRINMDSSATIGVMPDNHGFPHDNGGILRIDQAGQGSGSMQWGINRNSNGSSGPTIGSPGPSHSTPGHSPFPDPSAGKA